MILTPGFSLSAAMECAQASALAYQSVTIETELAHFLILPRNGYNIVAARGTANLRDAMTDADCLLDGDIHAGFNRAFESISEPVRQVIATLDGSPIFYCGHSLGGSLSVLSAFRFARPCDYLYTFGQPRVGNAKFAAACGQKLAGRHFRFVNQEDIVPRSPLWISGYRHSGQEIFFPSVGGMRFGAPLWLKLGSDIIGTYWTWVKYKQLAELADHGIAQYVARLERYNPIVPGLNTVPA